LWLKYPEIQQELVEIEKYILDNTRSRNTLLSQTAIELVKAGGKRLRPALVVLSAKFGKYDSRKIIPVAGAIEILHTATLVHDDIIDRAALRRGKPTVWQKYGSDMAVYTGDFLFTRAVLMLSTCMPADRLNIVARAIKTICEGEVDQYQDKYNIDSTVVSYLKRISRKTAVLFGAACSLGAYLSKCSVGVSKNLAKFGFYYGMAFQIRDDLNDIVLEVDDVGKPVCNDIEKGIYTLPVLYTAKKNAEARKALSEYSARNVMPSQEDRLYITGLLEKYGGINYAGRLLNKYIDRGMKALEALPDNEFRVILKELLLELRW